MQQALLGPIPYLLGIGLPSWQQLGSWGGYYRAPWEASADIFGGVDRAGTTVYDRQLAMWYMLMLMGIITKKPYKIFL